MKLNLIILYLLVIALGGFVLYRELAPAPQQAYVDNAELFNSFRMKEELEKKYTAVETQKKQILDSLMLAVRNSPASAKAADLDRLKQEYLYRQNSFEQENAQLRAEYNAQIWKQLNGYVKQYGEEHAYEFIFGTSGQGSLMYASDKKNVTKALVDYANQKYNGH